MGSVRKAVAERRPTAVYLNAAELSLALAAIGKPRKARPELRSAVRKLAAGLERRRKAIERASR